MARKLYFIYCVIISSLGDCLSKRSFKFSDTTSSSKYPSEEKSKSMDTNASDYIKLKLQIDNYSMLKCKCIESTYTRRELKNTDYSTATQNVNKIDENNADKNIASQDYMTLARTEVFGTSKRNANASLEKVDSSTIPNLLTTYKPNTMYLDDQKLMNNFFGIRNNTPKIELSIKKKGFVINGSNIVQSNANTNQVITKDNKTSNVGSVETKKENELKDVCRSFQNGQKIDLDKIPGAWNIIYYQMPENLSCFKMLIRKTTHDERQYLLDTFGDISYNVDWEKCHLEIVTENTNTRHYLQGDAETYGVLRNIILTKNDTTGKTTLQEETPDQWRIFGDILIMRDCESSEIAAFMRNSSMPTQNDVIRGLHEYGIEQVTGKVICYAFPEPQRHSSSNNNQEPRKLQDSFDIDEENEFAGF